MAEGSAIGIGDIIIRILADSSKLRAEMDKSLRDSKAFSGQMAGTLGAIGRVVLPAGIAVSIAMIGKQALESAAQLSLLSQKLGISVEELSKLDYIGHTVGLSIEQMSRAVGLLSKQMISGTDEFGKTSKALTHIGVSALDASGKMRPTIDVMADIAEKFRTMPDGAEKTALAMMLFGRSGKEMIPMLNLGKQGFKELGAEAERAGYVLSSETARQAHELEVQITKLNLSFKGTVRTVMAEVLPALIVLTADLDAAREKTKETTDTTSDDISRLMTWKGALALVATGFREVVAAETFFVMAHIRLAQAVWKLAASSSPEKAGAQLVKDLIKDFETMKEKMKAAGNIAADSIMPPKVEHSLARTKELIAELTDEQKKSNAQMALTVMQEQYELASMTDNRTEMERWRLAIQAANDASDKEAGIDERLIFLKDLLANRIAKLTLKQKDDEEATKRKAKADKDAAEKAKEYGDQITELFNHYMAFGQKLHDLDVKNAKERINLRETGMKREIDLENIEYQETVDTLRKELDAGIEQDRQVEDETALHFERVAAIRKKYSDDWMSILDRIRMYTAEESKTMVKDTGKFITGIVDNASRQMGDVFFDALTGNFKKASQDVKAFFRDLLHEVIAFVARQEVLKFINFMLNKYPGGNPYMQLASAGYSMAMHAEGGVFTTPHLASIAERGPEAVIPMPHGAIPIQFTGKAAAAAADNNSDHVIKQTIVIAPEFYQAMRTGRDEIVSIVGSEVARSGSLRNTIRTKAAR